MSATQRSELDGKQRIVHKPLYALVCSLLYCGAADAATRLVTSCADDNSPGTLRHEVVAAGSQGVVDLSGLACDTITLSQGYLTPVDDLSIVGPTDRRITILGNGGDRLFLEFGLVPHQLQLENVTVAGGRVTVSSPVAADGGACIHTIGSVVLKNSIVTDCQATLEKGVLRGGAIYARGDITLQDSIVSDSGISAQTFYPGSGGGDAWTSGLMYCANSALRNNSMVGAGAVAGGMYASNAALVGCSIERNKAGGALIVSYNSYVGLLNTTIAQNSGGDGIKLAGTSGMVVLDSTISGNSGGFGIDAPTQAVTIRNSTIVGNTGNATRGGGFYSANGVTAQSSIFAGNSPYDVYVHQSILAGADNLVVFTNATMQFSGSGVQQGAIVSDIKPRLTPLGNHGGTTRVHALLRGSSGIDLGNNSFYLNNDQRGAPRVSAGKADIGAYERQANDDELFYEGFDQP